MFAAANISERLKCSCIDSYSSIIRVTDLLSGEYHHLSYVFNAREKERTGPPGSDNENCKKGSFPNLISGDSYIRMYINQ